jgi:hypothetical protein
LFAHRRAGTLSMPVICPLAGSERGARLTHPDERSRQQTIDDAE